MGGRYKLLVSFSDLAPSNAKENKTYYVIRVQDTNVSGHHGEMVLRSYTSRVFSHLQLNFHSFPLQPASASSLRRHVATTLMQHRRANERNSRALQPVSPASYGSSLEVSIIIYQVSL